MVKKTLSLIAFAACMAVVAFSGMFSAKEQGPPGVQSQLEQSYISTTDTSLPAAPAIIGAALGLGLTVLHRMVGDRLRRSSSIAGRVKALLNHLDKIRTRRSPSLRLFMQSHVTTSR